MSKENISPFSSPDGFNSNLCQQGVTHSLSQPHHPLHQFTLLNHSFNYSTTLYIKPTTNQPLNNTMSHHTTLGSLAGTTPQHSIKLIYTTLGPTTNYKATPDQRQFHHLTPPDPTPHQTTPHLHYKGNCKEGSPILWADYSVPNAL